MSLNLVVRSKAKHSQKLRTSFAVNLSNDRKLSGKIFGSWLSFYITFDTKSLKEVTIAELNAIAQLFKNYAKGIGADPRYISVWDYSRSLSSEQKEVLKDFIYPFLTDEDIKNDKILSTLVL